MVWRCESLLATGKEVLNGWPSSSLNVLLWELARIRMLVFGATFILIRFTARQKVATILSIIAGLADFILGLIALITGILRLKIWLLLLWWTLLKHRLLARHIS